MKPKLSPFCVLLMLLVSKNPLANLRTWKFTSCASQSSPEKRHQQLLSMGQLRGSEVPLPCASSGSERGRAHSTVRAPVRLPGKGGGRQQTLPPVPPPLCSFLRAPWVLSGGHPHLRNGIPQRCSSRNVGASLFPQKCWWLACAHPAPLRMLPPPSLKYAHPKCAAHWAPTPASGLLLGALGSFSLVLVLVHCRESWHQATHPTPAPRTCWHVWRWSQKAFSSPHGTGPAPCSQLWPGRLLPPPRVPAVTGSPFAVTQSLLQVLDAPQLHSRSPPA